MTTNWHVEQQDDGKEVMMLTVRTDGLNESFDYAYRIAELMADTEAKKDFSVSADPTAVSVVLHAYDKGSLPAKYRELADEISKIVSV